MSTMLTSPAGTGEDRSTILIATSIVFGILSTLFVMLHVVYRIFQRAAAMTDVLITLAMVRALKPQCTVREFD
jgi:hypothetical protein